MNEQATKQAKRRFTVEQANAMLPLVKSIVADFSDSFQSVTGRQSDLHRLLRTSSRSAGAVYDDEMAESRADLQAEWDRIWKYREELESLGVIMRQPESGEISFPTIIDGRPAFYSWRMGEESIGFWRNADSPSSSRLPLRFDTAH